MRRNESKYEFRLRSALLAAAVAGGLSAAAAPASADGYHDRVYADSFGNLVIYSPSGYKRIVVGQGHLAGELSAYSRGGAAEDAAGPDESGSDYGYSRCRTSGVLLHGRSYMYGLPDNVVPVLRHPCR